MKKFLWLPLLIFRLLLYPQTVSAHVGGGPPFLEVNGVYAQTNPYFFNDPAINIPQDYTGKTYLMNKPISFVIDTNQLLVPLDIVEKSTFRWTFAENDTNYGFGTKLTHVYTKPGSYILSLEVKAPGETEYTLIDTVQLDVLPTNQYTMPKANISVVTDNRNSNKPLLFQSNFSADPSTKVKNILWGFGDGTTSTQQHALHRYTNLQDYSTFPVIFRVTDANGFRGYAGVIVESIKGKLHFINNLGKENTIPVSDTMINQNSSQHEKIHVMTSIEVISTAIGSVIVIIVISVFIVRRKKS